MTKKIKIGDLVKIRDSLIINNPYGTPKIYFNKELRKYKDKELIVTKVDKGYFYTKECPILLNRTMLSVIKKKKFKLKKALTKNKEEYKITIGSDPELCFTINEPIAENFFPAKNFLPPSTMTQLGCDGCSDIAELRPPYGDSPIEHLENIKRILRRLKQRIEKAESNGTILRSFPRFNTNPITLPDMIGKEKETIKLSILTHGGNGIYKPIGGHIHFNIPINQDENIIFLDLLDIMSIFLMPLEDKEDFLKRKGGHYGQLSAYETKSYGFEYRTMGSWLYSESNCRNILCLAYTLAYEWMNNRDYCEKLIKTFKNTFKENFYNFYSSYDIDKFINPFNLFLWFKKSVRKMKKYKEYKPYLENLFSLHSLKRQFREHDDIMKYWDFSKVKVKSNKFYGFNERDFFIKDIKNKINNEEESEQNIFIYGISRKNTQNYEVSTNNSYLGDKINTFFYNKNLNFKIRIEKLDSPYSFDSIGFSYEMRKNYQDIIVEILKELKNIDREYLNSPYDEEKILYENKTAETDTIEGSE